MGAVQRVAMAILGASLGLIIAVVVIELYNQVHKRYAVEWHDPNTVFDPHLAWRPVAGRSVDHAWGTISANREGFRSPPLDLSRRQIVLLGDSVGWGFGVGDESTLSYLMEPVLRPAGFQLSNLSVSGFGIDQHLLRLREELPRLSEQLAGIVVIICSKNDFNESTSNFTYGKRKMLFRLSEGSLLLTNYPVARWDRRNLLSESKLVSLFEERVPWVKALLKTVAGDFQLPEGEGEAVVIGLLRELTRVAQEQKVPMHFILSPDRRDIPEPGARYLRMRSLLLAAAVPFTDYQKIIAHKGYVVSDIYYDLLHYNRSGNQHLADTVQGVVSQWYPQIEEGVRPNGGFARPAS